MVVPDSLKGEREWVSMDCPTSTCVLSRDLAVPDVFHGRPIPRRKRGSFFSPCWQRVHFASSVNGVSRELLFAHVCWRGERVALDNRPRSRKPQEGEPEEPSLEVQTSIMQEGFRPMLEGLVRGYLRGIQTLACEPARRLGHGAHAGLVPLLSCTPVVIDDLSPPPSALILLT